MTEAAKDNIDSTDSIPDWADEIARGILEGWGGGPLRPAAIATALRNADADAVERCVGVLMDRGRSHVDLHVLASLEIAMRNSTP